MACGLELVVADDGRGLGLESMRQGAEEIGGSLEFYAGPARTTVRAVLPREAS